MGVTNLKSEISLRYPPAPSNDRKLLFEPAEALTQESGKCQPFFYNNGLWETGTAVCWQNTIAKEVNK